MVPLILPETLFWVFTGTAAFHAAYAWPKAGGLVLLYLFALIRLAHASTWRRAFYPGLAVGLLIASVRLSFFWNIFSGGAAALWLVLAFWTGLFVALARLCLLRFGGWAAWVLIPALWTGIEYFRSELYYLRFSWLSPAYALCDPPWQRVVGWAGAYGAGFLLAATACGCALVWRRSRLAGAAALAAAAGLLILPALGGERRPAPAHSRIHVAGVQMEFPTEPEIIARLDSLMSQHADTDLVVLSEYTLTDQVPDRLKGWCRKSRRYLIAGGKDPAPGGNFYNTAFVVSPNGKVVFHQGKARPIQFFKDGLPAPEQRVWNSPWGKLGICICYDLSYTRVTDRLAKLGAEALIVPTMDVADWGESQHRLHARVAPVRAVEYGLPIFRLASSGISQLVDAAGRQLATAPCPGEGAMLDGTLELRGPRRVPLDRGLALGSVAVTGMLILWFLTRLSQKNRLARGAGMFHSA